MARLERSLVEKNTPLFVKSVERVFMLLHIRIEFIVPLLAKLWIIENVLKGERLRGEIKFQNFRKSIQSFIN